MSQQQIMHVWPESPAIVEGHALCRAVIERSGAERFNLEYRFPPSAIASLTERADGFVCALLFLAMRGNWTLRVHGAVSPTLLRNLEEFQFAWQNMKPQWYTPVAIVADEESELNPTWERPGALLTFSGGADASYSLWRHTRGDAARLRRKIAGTAIIHGFDIPLDQSAGFERALQRAQAITTSAGVPLLPVHTNFRDLQMDWEHVHSAALAAVHLLLQKGYDCGLIASGMTYKRLVMPWGSQPVTDWMFSTADYPIIHDAAFVDRWQKLDALATWPEARQNLRICYEVTTGDNCGVCYKCLRSILLFRALGVGLPECFSHDVDDNFIRRWPERDLTFDADRSLQEILETARLRGTEGNWSVILQKVRKIHARRLQGRDWFKQLRTRVALRTRLRRLLGQQRARRAVHSS